jgi:hypothetical protein
LIEQISARYSADADEVVNKHTKRWAAKHGSVTRPAFQYGLHVLPIPVTAVAGEVEKAENLNRGKSAGGPTHTPRRFCRNVPLFAFFVRRVWKEAQVNVKRG